MKKKLLVITAIFSILNVASASDMLDEDDLLKLEKVMQIAKISSDYVLDVNQPIINGNVWAVAKDGSKYQIAVYNNLNTQVGSCGGYRTVDYYPSEDEESSREDLKGIKYISNCEVLAFGYEEIVLNKGNYICDSDLVSEVKVNENKEIRYTAKGSGINLEPVVDTFTAGYFDDLSAFRFFREDIEVVGRYEDNYNNPIDGKRAYLKAFTSEDKALTSEVWVEFIAANETEFDALLPSGVIDDDSYGRVRYIFDRDEMIQVNCKKQD